MKEISQTPYKLEFQYICVDTTPRAQLPDWLKQTPTLVIRNDQEPIKTNSDVMNWLYERKMKDPGYVSKPSASTASTAGNSSAEPEPWNTMEMGGRLSESYSNVINGSGSVVENSSNKNFDFGFLGGNAAQGDRTTQSIGDSGMRQEPGRQKSKKEEMFDRQMDAYQKNRDTGLPQARPRPT
jgi:hypothetical protein